MTIGPNLAAALIKAQSEFPVIPKLTKGHHGMYADLHDIKQATQKILTDNGLGVSQFPGSSSDGGLTLVTYLIHSSGESLSDAMPLVGKTDPQSQGSAITYARRYAYCAVLGIVADEDDDGNRAMPERRPQGKPQDRIATTREKPIVSEEEKAAAAALVDPETNPGHALIAKYNSAPKALKAGRDLFASISTGEDPAPTSFPDLVDNFPDLVKLLLEM